MNKKQKDQIQFSPEKKTVGRKKKMDLSLANPSHWSMDCVVK